MVKAPSPVEWFERWSNDSAAVVAELVLAEPGEHVIDVAALVRRIGTPKTRAEALLVAGQQSCGPTEVDWKLDLSAPINGQPADRMWVHVVALRRWHLAVLGDKTHALACGLAQGTKARVDGMAFVVPGGLVCRRCVEVCGK